MSNYLSHSCRTHNRAKEYFLLAYAKQSNCACFLSLSLPVSQSNSSLKKHRSRSIFSPFFCCFRNYNDYHVEPPPANNKTLSLPPPPEENGSPPKVKLIFLSPYLNNSSIQPRCQMRKNKTREIIDRNHRHSVTSNICLVLLRRVC